MKFSFYIIGTSMGRYSQYPDDYIAPTLVSLQKNLHGSRLVIFREMNLMHYAYFEKIGSIGHIGFCIIFNGVRVTRPNMLVQYFRELIEDNFIKEGRFIRYDENGALQFTFKEVSEQKDDYDDVRKIIEKEFSNNQYRYGIEELHTTYNGLRNEEYAEDTASDEEIIRLTDNYNKVVVESRAGIENGYIPQLMNSLTDRINSLNTQIQTQNNEIVALKKAKNQYKYVVALMLLLVVCCAGIGVFYNKVMHSNDRIGELEQSMAVLTDSVGNLNSEIENTVIAKTFKDAGGRSYTYSGKISNGKPNGNGMGIYSYGCYSGEFKNGLRHGKGNFESKDGNTKYVGTFANDNYDKGKLTKVDTGSYFDGEFRDGQPYYGKWYYSDGSLKLSVNDKPSKL